MVSDGFGMVWDGLGWFGMVCDGLGMVWVARVEKVARVERVAKVERVERLARVARVARVALLGPDWGLIGILLWYDWGSIYQLIN